MTKNLLYKATGWLAAMHRRLLPGVSFMYVASLVIGLLCGASAALLKGGVGFVTNLIFNSFDIHAGNLAFLFLPIIGILLATAFVRYVARTPLDHASERISADLSAGKVRLSPKAILGPIVACSVTLGMGGSAGAEDPIVFTGGAIGSNMGRAFRLTKEEIADLVGCGAAAAIAGIFMAPIGGVMFALEVLKTRQTLQTILANVMASLVAALTCYVLLGCHTDVTFIPAMRFDNSLIPMVLVCGLFCGLYSVYYSRVMRRSVALFRRVRNIWLKALTGGCVLAVMLYFFPSLYGEGYDTLRHLMAAVPRMVVAYSPLYNMSSDFVVLLLLMGALLLVKPWATSATNDSGGIGGDFTPTFFCGGIAGFLFAGIMNHFFGLNLPPALFAYFGMSAVMAGAVQAPLMAIFIASEITGLYGFILPLALSAGASYLTTITITRTHVALPWLHRRNGK